MEALPNPTHRAHDKANLRKNEGTQFVVMWKVLQDLLEMKKASAII